MRWGLLVNWMGERKVIIYSKSIKFVANKLVNSGFDVKSTFSEGGFDLED